MNRLIIIILFSLLTGTCYSKRISEQEALIKAQQFLKDRKIKESPMSNNSALRAPSSKNIYVFNAENNKGFVIISGDDCTPSVLGYSYNGFLDLDNIPDNMRWLLDSYESEISSLKDSDGLKPARIAGESALDEKKDIPILLNSQWGQNAPYNDLCPEYNGQKCLTGCVATAMAQIINFHKWPLEETSKIEGYTTFTNKIHLNELPSRKFNWDVMDYQEIANLFLYCGQSVNMNYGLLESATSTSRVPHALTDLFHFSKGSLYEERKEYSTQEWLDIIYNQLENNYPVIYGGEGLTSGSSHAFILDGYENGMFHVNWGWNGNCDGYFLLEELNPSTNNTFSLNQRMVSYACPPTKIEDSSRSKIVVHNISCNQSHLQRTDKSESFPNLRVSAIIASDLTTDAEMQIGFALYDGKQIVNILSQESCSISTTDNDLNHYDDIIISSEIPEGNYRLIAVNRATDNDDWLPDTKSHARYLEVSITDTDLLLQGIKKGNDGVENINFGYPTIDGLKYRLVCEYDALRAYLQPLDSQTGYSEKIYIPDFVEYDTFRFKVFGEEGSPFISNNSVTAISSPISLDISDCSNLESIEFREGVLAAGIIDGCPKLKRISYPASCRHIQPVGNCPSLTELSFQNKYPVTFIPDENGLIWSLNALPSLTDIYFNCEEPPSLMSNKGSDNAGLNIHVPNGMKETFQACGWEGWKIIDDLEGLKESIKWDYFGYDEDCDDGILVYSGDNDVELAMKIPSVESEKYTGNKIVAIEYFSTEEKLNDNYAKNPDYVFITENEKDYVIKQPTTAVRGAWTRVVLEEPYEINGEDIYIGVGRHNRFHMNWANMDTEAGGFWYRAMGTDFSQETPGVWEQNCGKPDLNFPMPIRAIIQGDNLPSDIAILDGEYLTNNVKPLTERGTISLKIRNRSPRLIKDLEFDLCYDGKRNESLTTTTLLPANHSGLIKLRPEEIRFNTHVIDLDPITVDNNTDAIKSNSTWSLNLLPTDLDHYPRITVMEEYTSTQDGSCSRGIAVKDYMKTYCADDFIAISIHDDDEMKAKDGSYDEFLEIASPISYAHINRTEWNIGTPFTNDVDKIKNTGEAFIKSEAEYTKDGRVNIVTQTTFSMNHDENDEFNIAYVLVEDRVGPYVQANNYSQPSASVNPNDYMNWWVHQENKVTYEFSDVARTIHPYNGFESLLPKNIMKDEVYDANYVMKIPDYIQNGEHLRVITLLIDKNSKEIINADQTGITGTIPDMSIELGDSNGDGEVNIADAVNIANFVVSKNVEKFHYTASDVNKDGNMSFADASATVSLILDQSIQSASEYKRIIQKGQEGNSDQIHINSIIRDLEEPESILVTLDNSTQYVALQADIMLYEGIAVDTIKIGKRLEKTHRLAMRHIDDRIIRITLFDLNNRAFTDSTDPILEIILQNSSKQGHVELRNIIVSDSDAHDYTLTSNDQTSGNIEMYGIGQDKNIELITMHSALEIRHANSKRIAISAIDGKRVATIESATDFERIDLSPGLYIVSVGNVSEKVMVK